MKKIILFMLASILLSQSILAITETYNFNNYELEFSYNEEIENEETFSLTATITNTDSNPKSNIELKLDDSNPFDIDDDKFSINSLNSQESKSNTFRIEVDEDAENKEYSLEFTLEDDNDDYEDELNIEVKSTKPKLFIGDIKSSPSLITPDLNDVELSLTLQNSGGESRFTKLKLILPEGIVSSNSFSDISNIGTISENGEKTATFFIDIEKEIESGNQKASIEIEYENDKGDKETKTLDFDIPIKGKPLFSIIQTQTNPKELKIDSSGSISIKIKNIGEEDGEETSIRLFESSDSPFEFEEKTKRIGTIKPNMEGTAVFNTKILNGFKPQEYLLRVQIRTINNGNVIITEETIPIKTSPSEKSNALIYFFIILIIISGTTFYLYKKKLFFFKASPNKKDSPKEEKVSD